MKKSRSAGANGRPLLPRLRHRRSIAVALVLLALLIVLAWGWTNFTRRGQITYNVLEHRLESLWVAVWGLPKPEAMAVKYTAHTGSIAGTVHDERGKPLQGAFVVASDRWGWAVNAQTDAEGHYQLEGVPAGWTVPSAAYPGYEDRVYGASAWRAGQTVRVLADQTTSGIDFAMRPAAAPPLPESILWGEQTVLSTDYPAPVTAQRTTVGFVRGGYTVTAYVYEPSPPSEGKLPALVAAFPGPPLDWEPAALAFVAQGYVVLGIGPVSMRDLDTRADTEDMIAAMQLFHRGDLSARVDPDRIVAVGGCFSTMALLRALHYAPFVRGAVLLGAISDAYAIRYAAYFSGYEGYILEPGFGWAMWSLGRPDRVPRLYIENSMAYHAQGLPPLCLIHGTADVVSPPEQSERLAAALDAAGQAYELHIYQDAGHYPGLYEPDAFTEAMYQVMIRFFAERIE